LPYFARFFATIYAFRVHIYIPLKKFIMESFGWHSVHRGKCGMEFPWLYSLTGDR
jgi:hypothetical protein